MIELGLKSKLSKKFKITNDSKRNYLLVENVLKRQYMVPQPSKALVSDITYIHTKEVFLYSTTIVDLYDRKIIAWCLSDGMISNETTLASWKMLIRNRNVQNGLIFYCDRGVE